MTDSVDQNGKHTAYTYESMLRPLTVIATGITSAGGHHPETDYTYTAYSSPNSASVEVKQRQDDSNWLDQFTYLDGLGRTYQTTLIDPQGNDLVKTAYDAMGRIQSVTNPYRTTSDSTYGTTSYTFDALNRATKVTQQDGTSVSTDYSNFPTVTVTDEISGQRQSVFDGLGRLVYVVEANAQTGSLSTGYPTSYTYSTLDNLRTISQLGNNAGAARVRSFTYDSLSRLLSTTNPESGTTCYGTVTGSTCNQDGYDGNGNLLYKTDANGNRVSYSYDQLNRVTGKTYSDGTPSVAYSYDQSTNWGATLTNGVGRLTTIQTPATGAPTASSIISYDALGELVDEYDCVPSICAANSSSHTSAQYDLAGHLISLTYPSTRNVTEGYSSAGRLLNVTFNSFNGTSVNYNYFGGSTNVPSYLASGLLAWTAYGNSVTEAADYYNRLNMAAQRVAHGATYQVNRSFSYANNGNLTGITDNLTSGLSLSFSYDHLNRVTEASRSDNGFYQQFSQDPWGNLNQFGSTTFNRAFDSNNRVNDYCNGASGPTFIYDNAGNMTNDCNHTYAFDAEERVKSVDTTGATYKYDAEGNRVRKDVSGSDPNEYLYFGGQMIAEYDPTTASWTDYIYGNSGILARATGSTSSGTYYYHRDHLGSTRLITDASGNVVSNCTYMPFGELVGCSPSVSWNHYSFTGDEHDSESNTEHTQFRQLSSAQGRWLSPDPYLGSMDVTNPQSLNRYAYVLNSPCTFYDQLGLDVCTLNIKVNNNAGLEQDQLDQIQARINAIYGATQTPDGNSVAVNFVHSGSSDYGLKFTPGNPSGKTGLTIGWGPIWFTPRVYTAAILSDYGSANFAIATGSTSAHELVHRITHIGDLPYSGNPNDANLMNVDSAITDFHLDAQVAADEVNPVVQGFDQLTTDQASALYKQCQKRHPGTATGGGGGIDRSPGDTGGPFWGAGYAFDWLYFLYGPHPYHGVR